MPKVIPLSSESRARAASTSHPRSVLSEDGVDGRSSSEIFCERHEAASCGHRLEVCWRKVTRFVLIRLVSIKLC